MRILVTGGTGFIGRWAVASLAAAGHDVFVVSRKLVNMKGCKIIVADLLDHAMMDVAFTVSKPEIVLHLAWDVEHGKFWDAAANLEWTVATIQLVSAAQRAGVRRIVCAGTCMEYDLSSGDVCSEVETSIRPKTLYAVSKDAARRIIEELAATRGIEFAWGRLFFLFGPNEHPNRLVSSIVTNLLARRPVLMSSGVQVRDFTNVRDAGEALASLAVSKVNGAVNIASGQALRIKELAEEILAAAGGIGELCFGALPDRPNEPPVIVADVTRLHNEVGYRPIWTMRDRLSETIQWWQNRLQAEHAPNMT